MGPALLSPSVRALNCIKFDIIILTTILIGNILLLRGVIKISPPNRPSASYEYLSALVGDFLVNTALDLDIASVFSILPKTQCKRLIQ